MRLPDNVYNIMKWVFLLVVPIGTFITSIIAAVATGDPIAIIATIATGIETLAGIVIKISDSNYRKELEG